MTVDLDRKNEDVAKTLGKLLHRVHLSTHIAHHILFGQVAPRSDTSWSPVRINEAVVGFNGDTNRASEVSGWRVASGSAIETVAFNSPPQRKMIYDYLEEVLGWRQEHAINASLWEEVLGINIPDAYVSDQLLGICNPLKEFELKQAERFYIEHNK